MKPQAFISHNNANEVSTTLHDLAHHINFCNGGERGHGTDFYNVFRELIFSALDLKKITLQEMKNMNLQSQKMRELAPELDPLRIGTGWKRRIFQSLRYM